MTSYLNPEYSSRERRLFFIISFILFVSSFLILHFFMKNALSSSSFVQQCTIFTAFCMTEEGVNLILRTLCIGSIWSLWTTIIMTGFPRAPSNSLKGPALVIFSLFIYVLEPFSHISFLFMESNTLEYEKLRAIFDPIALLLLIGSIWIIRTRKNEPSSISMV